MDPSPHEATRSRRRWPWVLAAIVVVVVVAVPFVVAALLDAERFRGRIEQALREATGWDAELGAIDVSVWRGMALTVSPATLSAPGGSGSRVGVDTLAVHAALRPLLRGELHVNSIVLDGVDARLVRPSESAGWSLPRAGGSGTPPGPAPAPPGPGAGPPPAPDGGGEAPRVSVSIDTIAVEDGRIAIEDRAAEPSWTVEMVDLSSSYDPHQGRIAGRATVAGGGGLTWGGTLAEGVRLEIAGLPTETLHPFLGSELIHAGGRLSGELLAALPGKVTGELTGDGIVLLAGTRPLETFAAELELLTPDGGRSWTLEELLLDAGGVRALGSGTLLPELSVELTIPSADLEATMEASQSILPLPLQFGYPGAFEAVIRADQPAGGELTYEASGTVTASMLLLGEGLPPARGVVGNFTLARDGSLVVELPQATVASGPLTGTARLASVTEPGTLAFDGDVRQATFGGLLSAFLGEQAERIGGDTGLTMDVGVDLARQVVDARALSGRVELDASQVTIPGLDIERAIRARLAEELGELADLADLVERARGETPPEAPADGAAPGTAARARELLRSVAGAVSFDAWPWRLERLAFSSGDVAAEGSGTFDPERGTIDLDLVARVAPEASAELVASVGELRVLRGDDGRLVLPLEIGGALTAPVVRLDFGEALRQRLGEEGGRQALDQAARDRLVEAAREALGEDAEGEDEDDDAVRGLLRGLLDKKKKKSGEEGGGG